MKSIKNYSLVLFLLLSICFCLEGKNRVSVIDIEENDLLRLESVGTETRTVEIDKVVYSKGELFKAKQSVKLEKNEYIKVTNRRTGALLFVCGRDFRNSNTSSIFKFIRKRYIGGKGSKDRLEFSSTLEKYPWQMLNDTIIIPIPLVFPLDNDHGFTITIYPEGRRLNPIPFNNETGELVLTKDYFKMNGMKLEDGYDYTFIVDYWDMDKPTSITDKFIIQYVPVIK